VRDSEGVCGAHQSTHKMKWMIRRAGYFWPTMLENCFKYYKGCQECQRFENIQKSLASAMNPIVKLWPFRGWGIDLNGQIFPSSSKGHKFVLVATDYFTKWVEAIPLKEASSTNVIEFIRGHMIYRFGVRQSITTDQRKIFASKEFEDFAANIGFKLINSSPYYAQANGKAEASNQILIKIIKKKIKEYPRKLHSILSETLWSYRLAYHRLTKCSPYDLVYGNEAMLPWEISLGSQRISQHDKLIADDYKNIMLDNLDDLNFHRLKALENIRANKIRIAKFYNQKV